MVAKKKKKVLVKEEGKGTREKRYKISFTSQKMQPETGVKYTTNSALNKLFKTFS
jgi:hypothetical protein